MTASTLRVLVALTLVISLGGCTWLKRKAYDGFWGRESWQQPARVIEALGLSPGDRVADLGAGGGYFTFLLAEAVGPQGRVYAVDVDTGLLSYLDERIVGGEYENVQTVLADFDDPRIPGEGVDLIFTSNTYHHIEDRTAYFERARRYLRPGGRVAIVEFKKQDGLMSWLIGGHSTDPAEIDREMRAAGYDRVASHDFLERQSFQVFRAGR
ncbi:MAG: methyltransferase domain-containing protein [Deltaproteobacteria bacterium]|nr:methyltransferase domain-containing protein [Deltaproteobacteria bacterium]